MRQFQVGLPLPAPIAIISLINQSYLPVKDLRFFARAKKTKKLKNMGAPKYYFFFRKKMILLNETL